MEQFNNKTYKKQTAIQEFTHSCLGRLIILLAIGCLLFVIAILTLPSDSMMRWQMEDNIRECIEASDSIQSDAIDDYVGNLGRIVTHADTARTDKEQWAVYQRYNRLAIYSHTWFKTALIHNNIHPEGIRVGVGIFGIVIPTVKYTDLLMNVGNVRGEYGERLIRDVTVPDNYTGENPNIQPYHYNGNPDD